MCSFSISHFFLYFGFCFSLVYVIDDGTISWDEYIVKYNKTFKSKEEEISRRKIFESTLRYIQNHNAEYNRGLHTYYVGINKLADLTENEIALQFPAMELNRVKRRAYRRRHRQKFYRSNLPQSIDWREYGIVSSVKYQGDCGSCWAFTSVAVLEIQNIRRVGRLLDLSEQQLIDCSKGYGNRGCDGGFIDPSFHYIRDNHGINADRVYPYEAKEGACRYNPYKVSAVVTQWVDLNSGDEAELQETVAYVGPVAAAFDGRQKGFRYYRGGIYFEPNCTKNVLDHSGVIVGYGVSNSMDYWIIKNSWGTSWGEKGYIRFARNRNNMCGIASLASYPLVF